MHADEPDSLFSAIDTFLHDCRRSNPPGECRIRAITCQEIEMLAGLGPAGATLEELAAGLGREACSTQELLDALTAVGVLTHEGDRYLATPATVRYCRALKYRR